MSDLMMNSRKDLFVLEDENNPKTTEATIIHPKTILDQVFDPETPTNKNLREILKEMRKEILSGGINSIIFPVRSVNRLTGDIILTKKNIGLSEVDNTSDIDKPLSGPQRNAVMDILKSYNFKVNLDPLYEHLADMNNPHEVSVAQINKDDQLTTFVQALINRHSLDDSKFVHLDIRNSLSRLWDYTERSIAREILPQIKEMRQDLNTHAEDPLAHADLFVKKEDLINKAIKIDTVNTSHVKYPTTRALVEYVTTKFTEYDNTHPIIEDYIGSIRVVGKRSDLPLPTVDELRNAYVIQFGNQSQTELAICKEVNGSYHWNIQSIGAISTFNPDHFENGPDGMSIKMEQIVSTILGQTGDVHKVTKNLLKNYYTKEETIQNFIQGIDILPGTMDGHIRYYVNHDRTTMSDDIPIPGLKTLAYLNKVTENEIRELSVHNRHILSKAVDRRCLAEDAVHAEHISADVNLLHKMRAPKGSILGNIKYENGQVHVIPVQDFVDLITGGVLTIPGINAPLVEVCYNTWDYETEIPFVDGSFGARFKGSVNSIANAQAIVPLSNKWNSKQCQILDSGGWWRIDTTEEIDQVVGSSSAMTGTSSEVRMTKRQLEFVSVSSGDRVNANFEVWIRYLKK